MARILGLSFYHAPSAAVLMENGRIIATALEANSDNKYISREFPKNSIEDVLAAGGLSSLDEIDAIVYNEKPILRLQDQIESAIESWPRGLRSFCSSMPEFLSQRFLIKDLIQENMRNYQGKIYFSERQLSLAYSAYFCSPFEEAAILLLDSEGQRQTTTLGVARNGEIKFLKFQEAPNSIPMLYRVLREYLGFESEADLRKFRELSVAGAPSLQKKIAEMIHIFADSSFTLNAKYFKNQSQFRNSASISAWEELFGFPPRLRDGVVLKCHADLACSGQLALEQLALSLAKEAKKISESDNLILISDPTTSHLFSGVAPSNSIWIHSASIGYSSALGAALVGSKTIFQENLDKPLGSTLSVEGVKETSSATSINWDAGIASIKQEVFEFYQKSPFNVYSNAIDAANALMNKNSLTVYRPLDSWLRKISKEVKILDAGCGAAWFLNSCAHYYGIGGIGIDQSSLAIAQARSVARFISCGNKNTFIPMDLFLFDPDRTFDLVNSLGVLHHTENCELGVRKLARLVSDGGYLQIGLYHRRGRAPFLKFVSQLKNESKTEQEMFERFQKIFGEVNDHTFLQSWFRDQVLHPHETQHDFEELDRWLTEEGMEIEATSLNHYRPLPASRDLTSYERKFEEAAQYEIYSRGRYLPGFFVVYARRVGERLH